ncbi:MAG TPA: zinc ribbon domain-containing protein [Chloroflexota bacterium]|nr:zinc ribbon domain-containing protein [Chloroflexota bacterium]HUM68012.1 zinc ribbon domain-containing protein [Chloroflexota bacterium]
MGKRTEDILAQEFVCRHCQQHGAVVEKLAMSGVGFSRFFDIQHHRYAFVSCKNCGYTEIFNLRILEGHDDVGTLIDIIFSG